MNESKVGKINNQPGQVSAALNKQVSVGDLIIFLQNLTREPQYTSAPPHRRHFSFRNLSENKNVLWGQFEYSEETGSYSFLISKQEDSDTLDMSCKGGNVNTFQMMIDTLLKLMDRLGQKRELVLSGTKEATDLMANICKNYDPPVPYKTLKEGEKPEKKTSPKKSPDDQTSKNKKNPDPEHSRLIFTTPSLKKN